MHTRVKDMSRDQQKAVFASMEGSGRLEGTEAYSKRREAMIKKSELAENTEDKIWKVMDNNKLTYRQKMIEVAKIKKHALKQLPAQDAGAAETAAVPAAPRSFQKKRLMVGITSVPKGISRQNFDSILIKKKLGKSQLFEHEGLLLTQKEYAIARKRSGHKLPEGARITSQPTGLSRPAFNSILMRRKPDKNVYIKVDGLTLSAAEYRKAVKRNARVRYGARDWAEKHKLELALEEKERKKTGGKIEPLGVRAIYEKTLAKKKGNYKRVKAQEEGNVIYWFENEKGDAISYVNAGTTGKPEYEIRQTYKGARHTIKSPLGSTFRASPETVLEMSAAHAQRRENWAGEAKAQKMYKKERRDHPTLPAKAVKTVVHDHMKKEGWEHNSPWKKRRNKKTPAQRAAGAVSGYLGQKLYERYSPEGRRKKAEEKLSHIKRVERAEQAEKQAKQAEAERAGRQQKEQAEHRRMQAEQAEKREERKAADERHRADYAARNPNEPKKRFGLF